MVTTNANEGCTGFSYGSLLGSTLVAMFPDKVDKVILDGVVNPFEYYQNM